MVMILYLKLRDLTGKIEGRKFSLHSNINLSLSQIKDKNLTQKISIYKNLKSTKFYYENHSALRVFGEIKVQLPLLKLRIAISAYKFQNRWVR